MGGTFGVDLVGEVGVASGVPFVMGSSRGVVRVDFQVFEGPTIRKTKQFKLLGKNWDRIFEKPRVGFGRTELSLRLS